MKSLHKLFTLLLSFTFACAGTSSGNPSVPNPGVKGTDAAVPAGITLAKSDVAREQNPDLTGMAAKTFASDNHAFAFELYSELAKKDGNLFFSPYSISLALAMTYAGAKTATASEMQSTLHYTLPAATLHTAFNYTSQALEGRQEQAAQSSGGSGFELDLVDQAWGQRGFEFLDSYLDVLAKNYGAGLLLVDFENKPEDARGLINDWVSDQTNKLIEQTLPEGSITSETRLVLTNTIYFKSNWLRQFDADETKPATFHAAAGERDVQMMHMALEARYTAGDNYQTVNLRYLSPDLHVLFVLPNEGDFEAVAKSLGSVYEAARSNQAPYQVTLGLPRFGFDSARTLKAPLKALGMNAAFSGGADFSGIDAKKDLHIDEVYHDTFIAVDEHGTEAAAATDVVINADAGIVMLPTADIAFDRPFFLVIYDEPTDQILFVGQLLDPS